MTRPKGAQNIVPFDARRTIETTSTQSVLHLAKQTERTCLDQFEALLRNQRNFLHWIDSRHDLLLEAKKQLDPNGRGPKDATYRKYRWYTQQQSLLEAINGFEVFYKASMVALADCLHDYVSPSQIKGAVDAKVLWAQRGEVPLTDLIFEHRIFHGPEQVDEATAMLVSAKRYNPNNVKSVLYPRVVALQCIFQIRHTLSHNQGRVTNSDSAKFSALGYDVTPGQVLDPGSNHLGAVVRDLLQLEAREFTDWLLGKVAEYLVTVATTRTLPVSTRDAIQNRIGQHADITAINWQ
ncbi:MAG: hypothetical protein KDA57_17805 [Planctomycetales bacterium]|nr:hypothetical protein [Planctomycetales bacterium]